MVTYLQEHALSHAHLRMRKERRTHLGLYLNDDLSDTAAQDLSSTPSILQLHNQEQRARQQHLPRRIQDWKRINERIKVSLTT